MTDHYDVIVIGTGAGGGTLAHRLASSGKRILMLERGEWLPRELDNWDSHAVFVELKYQSGETWHNPAGRVFHPGINYYVGGNTKVYGAALFRHRREDFGEVKHHGGISPAWPVSYEDFEPYYTQAEHLYQVHGRHGVDPTEPEASAEYSFPPVSHEPRIQEMADGLTQAGYHPFHLPLGILLEEEEHGKASRQSRCIRCSRFDGFPCLVSAKADSQVICVEPLLERPNVELLTRAYVSRLETDASGRKVVKVVVERDGETLGLSADVVVSSCGAINSALLLLRSASDMHPNGLANSSGVVGRHYMRHNNTAMLAISREPNPTMFEKTMAVNDFYFGAEDFDYPLGHIQLLNKSDEEMIKGEAPDWIPKPGMALDVLARHAADFWLTTEDLPDPENRVTLGTGGRVELRLRENNMEAHRRLKGKLRQILHHMGCHDDYLMPRMLYLGKRIPIGGTAHQCGTVRFGTDPASSALDTDCKAHDLDNLYVVDGSFFVSAAAVNPGLTIMANALRVGDHLLERLG